MTTRTISSPTPCCTTTFAARTEVVRVVEEITEGYVEPFPGAEERLNRALEVIVVTYYATVIKRHADELLNRILPDAPEAE